MGAKICFYLHILIFTMLVYVSSAKNILYMSTLASPSHNIWDKTLAMGLRNKGHTITHVTLYPAKSMENFTVHLLEGVQEKLTADFNYQEMNTLNFFQMQYLMDAWSYLSCSCVTESNGFKSLLKQAENGVKYDVIIFDISGNQCVWPIIEKFGSPPTVAVSAFGMFPLFTTAYGLSPPVSYIPMPGLSFSENMNIFERFYNSIATLYSLYVKHFLMIPHQMELAKKVFGQDVRDLMVYEKNFSIFLPNYDPVLTYPQPLAPAIIPVGGLHMKRANELPQDLKTYLDQSTNGAIVFSLGTNVRSDKLPEEKQKILLEAFAELKQNVIWKFESDLKEIPKNVIIRKFLPQNDLLAHPNVKLLINHGGMLSTQEGLYHGLPIIAMPFFADQESNTFELITKKLGLKLDFFKLSKQLVLTRINEVLYNETYRQNAQRISQRYRNSPDNALDRAIFWVEKVMREGGCDYLRLASRDMPYYQTELLDIWTFIATVLIIFYFICKKLYRILLKKSVKKLKIH